VGECENELSHSQVELPRWELESLWTPKSSESNWKEQNPSSWGVIYIIGKLLKRRCPKWARMTIWTFATQVMAKKKVESQIGSWLPTIGSWGSIQFPFVQVVCDMPLESSRWRLQLRFRLHPNCRFAQEVMNLQSCGSPNLSNFETPTWESQDKSPFGCHSGGEVQSILYGGRWWLPPNPNCGESCESKVVRGSS
jgi:hypothetical protein